MPATRKTVLGAGVLGGVVPSALCQGSIVRYVNQDTGDNGNDGTTPALAWKTIQYGIDQMPMCCEDYFLLIAESVADYDEELVVHLKGAGRLHLFGQPTLSKGTWAVPDTIAAYDAAPAGEHALRHEIEINGGTFNFAAGDEGKQLVVDFTGGGAGPFDTITILEVIDATHVMVAGDFPSGKGPGDYPGLDCVIAEPAVVVKPTTGSGAPVLSCMAPPTSPYEASQGVGDLYDVSLTWIALDGTANGPAAASLISEVGVAADACSIVNSGSMAVYVGIGTEQFCIGSYWGGTRHLYSADVAIDAAVAGWEVGATGATSSYLDPSNLDMQERHGGILQDDLGFALRTIKDVGIIANGTLIDGNVMVNPDTSLYSEMGMQIVGIVSMFTTTNQQLGTCKIDGELVISGASQFCAPDGTDVWIDCPTTGGIALVLNGNSQVAFDDLYVTQASNSACIVITGQSSLEASSVSLDRGAVAGPLLQALYLSSFVTGDFAIDLSTKPQSFAIQCAQMSRALVKDAFLVPAAPTDYDAAGAILADDGSQVWICAPSANIQNTLGPGLTCRRGSSINTPNGYGAGATNQWLGNATPANDQDMGGTGALAYAPGTQTDLAAPMPQMCARYER